MVSWWWIPVALWVGAGVGIMFVALFTAGKDDEDERDHFRADTKKEDRDVDQR